MSNAYLIFDSVYEKEVFETLDKVGIKHPPRKHCKEPMLESVVMKQEDLNLLKLSTANDWNINRWGGLMNGYIMTQILK